ncbi:MoaD/ThiS family protein [Methanobrevibacter filiformis]|uniref:ThiS family protein n=1 Tax=Methanobrevibacter filiformis TaxID=55758 RepID=A0A166C8P3_9EURY|nr:MoaD/ThiS family protein [Methanobrevibacter filiformis]KZX12227.1 ThiS family protein [Methanobrevibacter filiformis]
MTYTLIFENKKEEKPFVDNTTIKDLLDEIEASSETLVVKKNKELVEIDELIQQGDEIQLIQIIYGG